MEPICPQDLGWSYTKKVTRTRADYSDDKKTNSTAFCNKSSRECWARLRFCSVVARMDRHRLELPAAEINQVSIRDEHHPRFHRHLACIREAGEKLDTEYPESK